MILVRQDMPPRKEIGHSVRSLRPAAHWRKGDIVRPSVFIGKLQKRGLLRRRCSTYSRQAVQFILMIVRDEPDEQADGNRVK